MKKAAAVTKAPGTIAVKKTPPQVPAKKKSAVKKTSGPKKKSPGKTSSASTRVAPEADQILLDWFQLAVQEQFERLCASIHELIGCQYIHYYILPAAGIVKLRGFFDGQSVQWQPAAVPSEEPVLLQQALMQLGPAPSIVSDPQVLLVPANKAQWKTLSQSGELEIGSELSTIAIPLLNEGSTPGPAKESAACLLVSLTGSPMGYQNDDLERARDLAIVLQADALAQIQAAHIEQEQGNRQALQQELRLADKKGRQLESDRHQLQSRLDQQIQTNEHEQKKARQDLETERQRLDGEHKQALQKQLELQAREFKTKDDHYARELDQARRLGQDLESKQQKLRQEIQQLRTDYEERLAEQSRQAAAEKEHLQNKAQADWQALDLARSADLAAEQATWQSRLDTLQAAYEQKLQENDQAAQGLLEGQQKETEQKLTDQQSRADQRLAASEETWTAKVADLQARNAATIQALENSHRERLENLEHDRRILIEGHKQELEQVQSVNHTDLERRLAGQATELAERQARALAEQELRQRQDQQAALEMLESEWQAKVLVEQGKVQSLQEELDLQQGLFDEERVRIQSELQKAQERHEHELRLHKEQVQALQNQIQQLQTESRESMSGHQAQMHDLQETANQERLRLESSVTELQVRISTIEAQAAQEQNRKDQHISELQAALAERDQLWQDDRTRFEHQIQELEARPAELAAANQTLQTELNQLNRQIQQTETDYHDKVYTLNQKLLSREESAARRQAELEKERRQHLEEIAHFEERLTSQDQLWQKRESELQALIEKHLTSLAASESSRQQLEQGLQEHKQLLTQEQKTVQAQERQIQTLGAAIDDLKRDFEREQSKRASDHQTELDQRADEIRKQKEQLDQKDDLIRAATRNAEALKSAEQEQGRIIRQLEQGRHQDQEALKTQTRKIADLDQKIEILQAEIRQGADLLQQKQAAWEELHRQLAATQNDLAINRERLAVLEGNLGDMHAQEQQLNRQISELQTRFENLNGEKSRIATELSETRQTGQRIRKELQNSQQELQSALKREQGSREAGRTLGNLLESMGQSETLYDRIRILMDLIPVDPALYRISVWSLVHADQLHWITGAWQGVRLEIAESLDWKVAESSYGRVLATQKADLLQADSVAELQDFPTHGLQLLKAPAKDAGGTAAWGVKQVLAMPLLANQHNAGLLLIAFSKPVPLDGSILQQMEQISPLLALNLAQNEYHHRMDRAERDLDQVWSISQFQNLRYWQLKTGLAQIQSVASDTGTQASPDPTAGTGALRLIQGALDAGLWLPVGPDNGWTGLPVYLDQVAQAFRARGAIQFTFSLPAKEPPPMSGLTAAEWSLLYWILEEAITNVIRHAKASILRIELNTRADGSTCLSVVDNGEGLIRTSGQSDPENGRGLPAIKRMASLLGATIAYMRDERGYGLALQMCWAADTQAPTQP
ncbi:MAG: hypothetical protein KDK39_00240 [Leptospiraceae bacterium]|nr:hypothetical protein [Leptospiraceae bacterium]